MSNDYSREVLRRVVAQVCQIIGWQGINSTPLDILVHILEKYILTLCTQTQRYAEQFNRTEANLHDLGLVFRDIHIPLQELREYTRCVPPVQCHLNVSNFPLPKESRLNFLKPGSQEVLTRPVHVHEYLPAMFPEKEKDSAPPIASTVEITHNGTDTQHDEACKSPEISVTDVDKQKDIFKRPNDPVSLTPPGLKRPRLKLEEEDCHTREISSVMMTMSGFLSPAREGKLPEARTPIIVHDTHPEKVKSNPHHPPASPHPSAPPHPERSEKKSKKNKALNGKIDKGKKKEKAHKNIPAGKQKNAENRNNKLAMHLARGKVRPSGSVKHHAGEMPPLKQLPLSLDTNSRPIKQEEIEKPAKVPPVPFNPALQPPPLVQIHKNPPQQYHQPHAISEPPTLLPSNITIKEEVIESEKLTSQPDRSKLNIFKKISSKIKEERHSDMHDRFVHDNGAIKIEKSISRCSSPTLVIDEPDMSRKMAHVKESIDFVVSNSIVGHSTSSNSAVDLTSKRANPVVNDVINVDEDSNEFRKHVFKQELSDDLPKDLSKPKLNAVHNLPPSPIVKEKKERKRRERKPKPDKALKEYTKMLKKQQLEKMQSIDAAHAEMKFSPRLGFPMFPLIPGAGPGLIPGGVFSGFIPPTLRGLLPPDTSSLLPNPYSMAPGASGSFNRQDFLQSVPGLIPPNISNPLLSHLNHSFGKPPHMPQHPNISSFLRRPSLEVIPIEDDVIPQAPTKKSKQSYLSPPLVIKEKEKLDKSRISPNNSMIVNNISTMRTSPVKQSPPKPNPVIKMPAVKPDITIKLNPPEKVKVVDVPKPQPVLSEEPILPTKEKEKDKAERKKDKLHKKEKKDKELKIKKKKDKKDKLKIKIEKKKEKEERHDSKEKSKKEKKEKRKEKEKTSPLTIAEGLVPKLTLKLGPASPMLPPSPEHARKLIIKPVIRKEEPVLLPVEPLPIPEDRLSAERSQSPELARISALVTRPPKSKPHHKHISPVVKAEPNPDLGRSLSPPPMPSNSSPTRKSRPPTFSKYKRIYFKPIPKRSDGSIIDLDQEEGPVPTKDVTMPEKFPNVPLGTPFYMDPQGNKVWICPACGSPDNGSPMIGCDGGCDGWYHWVCVGIRIAPDDTEDWYCTSCIAKKTAMASAMAGGGQMAKKRGRKPKAEKSKEILLG